jgi:hypothetical protein
LWREPELSRPFAEINIRITDDPLAELIGPVRATARLDDETFQERLSRRDSIAFRQPYNDIRIFDPSERAGVARHRQVQDHRAPDREDILMGFERAVQDHVTGFDCETSAIAGFEVSALQHQRRVGMNMTVPAQPFPGGVLCH